MTDIAEWLRGLGLSKYASVFAEASVDLEILPRLSEGDLRELGLPLGVRKKILEAVPAIGQQTPTREPSATVRTEPERRQITVMFCDVAGSTSLSEQMDVEDFRSLLLIYQRTCAEAIQRYGGHVAQYLGDGVLAYFGYPEAHEDDAVRAVHAGLTIVTGSMDTARLTVRVGLHTGLVVTGEMGGGASRESLAVGETPNIAARIQALADPGSVVVSDATWQLIEGFFAGEPLGTQSLKGLARSIVVHRIVAPTGAASRFAARMTQSLTPLVGREIELAFLEKLGGSQRP